MCMKPHKGTGGSDPLNWARAAAAMRGSHLEEVKEMVATYYQSTEVAIEGVNLTVGQVTAVARRPEVKVVLDAENAKSQSGRELQTGCSTRS